MPKLSDTTIRSAMRSVLASGQGRKLYDENGLFLQLKPQERRCGAWWRQRYRWGNKEQLLSLGTYPSVPLAEARARRDALRSDVAREVNPARARKDAKLARLTAGERTFKAVGERWLTETAAASKWSPAHAARVRRRREVHFDPWIGGKDVGEVTEEDIAACLARIVDRQLFDTARRARSELNQLFRFARRTYRLPANPVTELVAPGVLPSVKVQHHASLKDPREFGQLLAAINAYHGGPVVRAALKLLSLTFVRPGELRLARWDEFQRGGPHPEWRIPAERMKMGEQHLVPLSRQALSLLGQLEHLTGPDGYVFPQARNLSRPISNNTLNAALRTMGYTHEQMTSHGFRSAASTLLNERGFNRDWIERQLAHGPRDKVRGAYNAAEYLSDRRSMMQTWADLIDELSRGEAKKSSRLKR